MVCGASTVFAEAVIVTIPVYVPAESEAVFNASWSGMQEALAVVVAQARDAPPVGVIHEIDDVRVSPSAPSPALYASTVCGGAAPPTATGIGPTVVLTSRSIGAACTRPPKLKRKKTGRRR